MFDTVKKTNAIIYKQIQELKDRVYITIYIYLLLYKKYKKIIHTY